MRELYFNHAGTSWPKPVAVMEALGSGLHCAPLVHETLGTQETGLVRLSVGIGQADAEIDAALKILRDTLTR